MSLGAVKSTPINALIVESNELPLNSRRVKLSLAYWTSIKSYVGDSIAKDVPKDCCEYVNKNGRGFGWDINRLAKKQQISDKSYVL